MYTLIFLYIIPSGAADALWRPHLDGSPTRTTSRYHQSSCLESLSVGSPWRHGDIEVDKLADMVAIMVTVREVDMVADMELP